MRKDVERLILQARRDLENARENIGVGGDEFAGRSPKNAASMVSSAKRRKGASCFGACGGCPMLLGP